MIQRIQSIYLLLAAILMVCLATLSIPVFVFYSGDQETGSVAYSDLLYKFGSDGSVYKFSWAIALCVIVSILSLITILLFKRRNIQLLLNRIAILLTLILPVYTFWKYFSGANEKAHASLGWGVVLPFVVIALYLLASRAIKKDDKLVRSMSRLR